MEPAAVAVTNAATARAISSRTSAEVRSVAVRTAFGTRNPWSPPRSSAPGRVLRRLRGSAAAAARRDPGRHSRTAWGCRSGRDAPSARPGPRPCPAVSADRRGAPDPPPGGALPRFRPRAGGTPSFPRRSGRRGSAGLRTSAPPSRRPRRRRRSPGPRGRGASVRLRPPAG